ncbi:MAG: TOBE domain-containing protein [Candidatus Omnitrophica bacterium]|nr:TOBE domain-containing protein [Candidatus Omnitrophota bacterium]MDE2008647.1 TOBE domain-containing protein [Candidatus Omnitrophota bacterium]MDE2214970.1 TOBE domain-containing protein [Candidatus Omnitrophota bacterium]MDE2230909.1 TOBE domain-containing protein [Candidatus Omnitrophota bacterium]
MNKLTGKIVAIETSPHMSLVTIDVDGDLFSSIVLETPATAGYLKEGGQVALLFKETEVSIAKGLCGLISLRNRFQATVKKIDVSDILSKIFLDYKNKEIVSVITTRSTKKLGLAEGDLVEWLVKTNEVSLYKEA